MRVPTPRVQEYYYNERAGAAGQERKITERVKINIRSRAGSDAGDRGISVRCKCAARRYDDRTTTTTTTQYLLVQPHQRNNTRRWLFFCLLHVFLTKCLNRLTKPNRMRNVLHAFRRSLHGKCCLERGRD